MDKRKTDERDEKCFDIAITVLFKEIYIYIYILSSENTFEYLSNEMEEGNGCYAKYFRIG